MTWITDLSKAPRGKYVVESRKVKGGKTADHRIFKADRVWLATKCGVVTLSWYMPERKQWLMLAKGEDPVAWHPFDENDTVTVQISGRDFKRFRKPDHPFPELVPTDEQRSDRLRQILDTARSKRKAA